MVPTPRSTVWLQPTRPQHVPGHVHANDVMVRGEGVRKGESIRHLGGSGLQTQWQEGHSRRAVLPQTRDLHWGARKIQGMALSPQCKHRSDR